MRGEIQPARSLPESFRSIAVPHGAGFWRKLGAFSGPGYLVAVGYMDPGNWATDIAGGSAFGYTLLSVILLSNLMAIVLQSLAARLGIATGHDLAQACREYYSRPVAFVLWALCELAIVACDLAEVIGTAIALQLLFGIPLVWGVCLTALDVLLILLLQQRGFRYLEAFIVALLIVIATCFVVELAMARPEIAAIAAGFVPSPEIVRNPAMLYIAIGIIGATVMPHNLYLHSAVVQTRAYDEDAAGKREAIRFATIDSTVALSLALFINAAILILAAATFHVGGRTDVAEIQDAHQLLAPMLGTAAASTLFAVALLASGQNSTITATLAGQIVMEGFLRIRLPAWVRRLVTRLLAIVPAVAVAAIYGESGTARLLVLSQVVLSMQLPFAVIPLVWFTGSRARMGEFVAPMWLRVVAGVIAAVIVGLNLKLLGDVSGGVVRRALGLALLLAATPVAAQQAEREFTPDRPGKTESPITVPTGRFQVELDLATWTRDRDVKTLNVAPVNLKLGLSTDTDVQLIVGGYLRQSAGGRTIDGIGDTTIRLKHNLWGNDGGDTAFALMPFVTLPTARDALGSGHVEGGIIAPLTVKLAETFDLAVMTEVDAVRREDERGYTASFVNSATLDHDLTDKVGAYVELYTERAAAGGPGWIVTGDVGMTLKAGDEAQFDAGVNLGLSAPADDVNLFVGYSRRF